MALFRERGSKRGRGYFYIGIDFGTTFSGVAWANSQNPDNIKLIQDWPGCSGPCNKVPSTIRYESNGQKHWGFEASPDDPTTLEWFKLLLVDEKELPEGVASCYYFKRARERVKAAQKQPQGIVKDYLELLWKHTVNTICKSQRESVVKLFPFRVVLTVPATWAADPRIVAILEQAAEQAGIKAKRDCGETILRVVAEPEAAAFSEMKDSEKQDMMFQDGDIFMICDAGGGTVDLITYEIEDSDRMMLRECAEGDGGPYGSIFLDQRMEQRMSEWLDKGWTKLTDHERARFKNDPQKWTRIKHDFNGNEHRPFLIDIGQDLTKGLVPFKKKKFGLRVEKRMVYFDVDNMKTIFDPVIDKIIELVGGQVQRTKNRVGRGPKVLILVGGLGGNKYLYERLKRIYDKKLEIIQRQGDPPIIAVCRGAVLKAISNNTSLERDSQEIDERVATVDVTSRISRASFGISFMEEFNAQIHDKKDKILHEATGRAMATNQMYWYLRKGEAVSEIDRPSYTWRRHLLNPLPRNRFTIDIYKCSTPNPPDSKREYDTSVFRYTNVSCLVETPFNELPRCENPDYRQIVFQLDLVPRGPRLEFVAMINGKICGRQNVDITFV